MLRERLRESLGLVATLAAGIAWSLPLPALYIINSLSGSCCAPLRVSRTGVGFEVSPMRD
jgi:hypothetical protein